MNIIFASLFCAFLVKGSASQGFTTQEYSEVFFEPANLTKVATATTHLVKWFTTYPGAHHASYQLLDPNVASVEEFKENFDKTVLEENLTGKGSMNVSAIFIGYDTINITIYDKDNNTLGVGSLKMSVLLSYEKLNRIFTYILAVFIFIVYINMGATLNLEIVKQIIKKPVGPLVGIVCQYGLMPVFAFGLAKLFFPGNSLLQLGMFLLGSSPGGGNSNMWTFLLGGSLDLSIMMTFTSTIVAFGTVPLWVLTLGPKIIGENSAFTIPYDNIATLVVSLVIPCVAGLLLQRYIPKLAKFLETRVLAPFSIFNIIFIFSFGTYSHRYVFAIIDWEIIVASFALPLLGYLSGLIISSLARRTWKEIIAISIETGVQNANIAIIILKFTLEQPAGDLAVVLPACGYLMTPLPLLAALIIKKLYGRFARSGGENISTPQVQEKGVENGMMNHLYIPDVNIKETAIIHGKENSSTNHPEEMGTVTHHKLFGEDNPSVDLSNDIL